MFYEFPEAAEIQGFLTSRKADSTFSHSYSAGHIGQQDHDTSTHVALADQIFFDRQPRTSYQNAASDFLCRQPFPTVSRDSCILRRKAHVNLA